MKNNFYQQEAFKIEILTLKLYPDLQFIYTRERVVNFDRLKDDFNKNFWHELKCSPE